MKPNSLFKATTGARWFRKFPNPLPLSLSLLCRNHQQSCLVSEVTNLICNRMSLQISQADSGYVSPGKYYRTFL